MFVQLFNTAVTEYLVELFNFCEDNLPHMLGYFFTIPSKLIF